MKSLRKTLVLGTTLATAAIFAVAGILLYVLVRASLTAQFDRALLEQARLLSSAVELEQGRLILEFDDLDTQELQERNPAAFLQLWQPDGSVLYRSPGVAKSDLKIPDGRRTEPVWYALRLPDERPGRAVSFFFAPRVDNGESDDDVEPRPDARQIRTQSGRTVALVFARSTDRMREALARLRWLLVLVGLASITVSTSLLWWLVRHGLLPLERLAREIHRVEASDLSTSIDPETCPREIRPVVDRFNDLLARLDAAFGRERAFSANVAHELRNPLTALSLKMDVARSRSRGANEYEEAIDQCRQITEGMRRMVENLLSLARFETDRIAIRAERVRLDELIDELWKPLEPEAEERRLDVRWSMTRPLILVSNAPLVGLIVRNILENAVAYADPGGSVEISTSAGDGAVKMTVRNSGSRLARGDAESVFIPFWRGDEARSDAGTHCGLGLSLVKKSVTVLGGVVNVRSQVGGDFEIAVSFPDRDDASE